ncbi:MAG: hypothetical protein Q8L98_06790, partial [Chlamydiales bacterium]|nr:hypothetical protein [Chlamydiales bacterium]
METMMGFLYENYKPELWWAEVLLLLRRISIAAVVSLIPEGRPLSQELVLVILVSFLFLFQFLQPYRHRTDVNCEIISIVSLLILINTGANYQKYDTKSWLNILGLVIYLGTLIMLVAVMIYPQLKKHVLRYRRNDDENSSLLSGAEDNESSVNEVRGDDNNESNSYADEMEEAAFNNPLSLSSSH